MKRLAIFIGGLLVMPAFAEVAPIFIDDENALEYTDAMYDENGFLIIPDEEVVEETTETVAPKTPVKISRQPVSGTPVANRSTSTRAMPASSLAGASGRGTAAGNSSRVVASRGTTGTNASRAAANRAVNSRAATNVSPRTTTTATTSTRSTTNTAATRAAAARATGGASRTAATTTASVKSGVARTATTAGRATGARATTNVSRAATTDASRPSVRAQYVGAANKNSVGTAQVVTGIDSTGTKLYKSASIRTPTTRMSTLTETSVAMSMEDMDDLAEMTDYCKAQYASCMDNYCNVLDDNQGRCSCSANLKNYAKAEAALKSATEELQDVAQKIQYIGLTKREVESLFTQTAAEAAMQSAGKDTSQLQTSLDKIKDMIIDVKSGGATSNAGSDFGFDLSGLLEFSFDSTGFDLGSLFGTSNTNSVNNQRGEQLYKTAAARCKTSVIKACTARGVDASLITNAYDLEIDRECIMYERSLNDSNDEMLATVRNAKNVLQKARLMVAQQKNTYDMRGCINALDECMQDDFVCGSEYENCLDPTGRYIVNGEIVVGSQPGHAIDPELRERVASVMTSDVCRVNLYRTWDFPGETCTEHTGNDDGPTYEQYPSTYAQNNAWGSGTGYGDNLVNYIEKTVKKGTAKNASENMSQYLQNKIGYVDAKEGRNYGMCISVLNKCQDYTYTGKGTSATYNEENDVIKQYLGRVLVQIKAKQDAILSEYAETCVADVTSCLSQNGYPEEDPNEWEAGLETTTNTTKANIAVNACRAQVVTCMSVNGYSIDTPTPTEMNCWVQGLLYNYTTPDCLAIKSSTIQCTPTTLRYCDSKSDCGSNGGYWCASRSSCYSSLSEYTTYCTGGGQYECEEHGGTWCDGVCVVGACPGSGDTCQVTLAPGNGCGSASQLIIPCDKTSRTAIHGFVSDDNDSVQVWSCPNNDNLETVLNSLGNGAGLGMLEPLSTYGITQSTTCTAICYSSEGAGNDCKVIFQPGVGCGTANPIIVACNSTTSTNLRFATGVDLQTWSCVNSDPLEDGLNELGGETGIGRLDNISAYGLTQSTTCTAVCYDNDGSNPYPTVTIDCGSGNTFNGNYSTSHTEYIWVSGTGHSGSFRKSPIGSGDNSFIFTLAGGLCKDSDSNEAVEYVCGSETYTAGEQVTVNSSITCFANYDCEGGKCSGDGGTDDDGYAFTLKYNQQSCGRGNHVLNPTPSQDETVNVYSIATGDLPQGYSIDNIQCYQGTTEISMQSYKFSMPAADVDCYVTCSGGGNVGGDNGTHNLFINYSDCGVSAPQTLSYAYNTNVNIGTIANSKIPSGYSVKNIACYVNNQAMSQSTFYMPNADVNCNVTCNPPEDEPENNHTLTVNCRDGAFNSSDQASGTWTQLSNGVYQTNVTNGGNYTLSTTLCRKDNNTIDTEKWYCVNGGNMTWGNNYINTGSWQPAPYTLSDIVANKTCFPLYMDEACPDATPYWCDYTHECVTSESDCQTPALSQSIVQFKCDSDDADNPATLNQGALAALAHASNGTGTLGAAGNIYTIQTPAASMTLSGNLCSCTSGTITGWSNTASNKKSPSGIGPTDNLLLNPDVVQTLTPVCSSDEDECSVTFAIANGQTEQCNQTKPETYSCGDSTVTVPVFFANGGAQEWTCSPNGVVNLNSLGDYGTGSVDLIPNTSVACYAQCILPGELQLECGEGTSIAGVTRHFVVNTNDRTVSNLQPMDHYCTAPTGYLPYQWSCVSSLGQNYGGTSNSNTTTFSVEPGEFLTCTAQYQSAGSGDAQTVKLTVNCGAGELNGITSPLDKSTNTPFNLDSTWCTRDGYTLSGWLCANNNYEPNDSITITGTTTCMAQWSNSVQPQYIPVNVD